MGYDGLGYGAGSMRSVFAGRQRSCHRRSTAIKSTIPPSIWLSCRGEIAKGTIHHN